jgi:hypothetical protein
MGGESLDPAALVKRVEKLETDNITLVQSNNELREDVDKLLTEITKLNQKIGMLEEKIGKQEKTVAGSCDWSGLLKGTQKQKSSQQVALLQVVAKEQADKDDKALNVVIFGMPSISTYSDLTEKKNLELESVKKIFDKIGVASSSIANVRSLRTSNNSAPLVVKLRTLESKGSVLRSSKKLKSIDEFKKVFINPDLTEVQRKRFKELLEEKKKHNANRSADEVDKFYFGIRNERVVKLFIRGLPGGGGNKVASSVGGSAGGSSTNADV